MSQKKNICFAYFVEGRFVGWYADTFGSVRPTPKIYTYSDEQVEIVFTNCIHKLEKINTSSYEEQKEKVTGLRAIGLLYYDSEDILRGKEVELRVVECPFYVGFDPSGTWVDANIDEVKEWAKVEPVEYIGIIRYEPSKKEVDPTLN